MGDTLGRNWKPVTLRGSRETLPKCYEEENKEKKVLQVPIMRDLIFT